MDYINEPITDALQTKCRSCGGVMKYSPEEEDLKCIYCGFTSGLDKTPVEIIENDFDYWKDRADESADEEVVEIPEIKCRQCGATTTLPENTSGAACVFCGTPLIMNEALVKRFWQPEYLLPFKDAKKKMDGVIEDTIKVDIGGDNQRIKYRRVEYNNLKFKHLLLPAWISAFKYNNKVYQFVVNGRTGQVIGQYPKDKKKIIILIVAIIIVIAALIMIF